MEGKNVWTLLAAKEIRRHYCLGAECPPGRRSQWGQKRTIYTAIVSSIRILRHNTHCAGGLGRQKNSWKRRPAPCLKISGKEVSARFFTDIIAELYVLCGELRCNGTRLVVSEPSRRSAQKFAVAAFQMLEASHGWDWWDIIRSASSAISRCSER